MMKSVNFSSLVKQRCTLHISDYDGIEVEATFYTAGDFVRFKEDGKYTAQLVDDGFLFSDSTEFCRRGVESMTRHGSRTRSANRKTAQTVVFTQQDRMWDETTQPPEGFNREGMIAAAYAIAVGPSVSIAYAAGLEDEKFIQSEAAKEQALLLLNERKSAHCKKQFSQQQRQVVVTRTNHHPAGHNIDNYHLRRLVNAPSVSC